DCQRLTTIAKNLFPAKLGTPYAQPVLRCSIMDNSLAPIDSPQFCHVCGKMLLNVSPGDLCPQCFAVQGAHELRALPSPSEQIEDASAPMSAEPLAKEVPLTVIPLPLPPRRPWERFRNWVRQHPMRAGFGALVLLVILVGAAMLCRSPRPEP